VISSRPIRASLSVTIAVIVCVPSERVRAIVAPVPSAPSRLDDHCTRLEMSPSFASVALACRVTVSPT
jgi:hypothetical protein